MCLEKPGEKDKTLGLSSPLAQNWMGLKESQNHLQVFPHLYLEDPGDATGDCCPEGYYVIPRC